MKFNSAELLEGASITELITDPLRTYISEAKFFKNLVLSDTSKLSRGSHLIEIGSGIGLLALYLASIGFEVTAFEPQSSGFNQMNEMRSHISTNWKPTAPQVEFIEATLDQETKIVKHADYIFAINVIEHVHDYENLIANAIKAKTPEATLRIICPNYSIPYEPHFNIPIIFTKRITKFIFGRKIRDSKIPNSEDFWKDLSWPTQRGLKKMLKSSGWSFEFSHDATREYLTRSLTDSDFVFRKGPIIGSLFKAMSHSTKFVRFVPHAFLPVIDCRISNAYQAR
ncbi:MAG: methyltransferase domain-containing protein [Gammaproteobacteria bacterium]